MNGSGAKRALDEADIESPVFKSDSRAVSLAEDDEFRSNIVRELVQSQSDSLTGDWRIGSVVPKTIVQFWDTATNIPEDVQACMNSWTLLGDAGFAIECFDDWSARRFIANNWGLRHLKAFSIGSARKSV